MTKILVKFWPALIPIALYILWRLINRKKHKENQETIPPWEAKLLTYTLYASIFITLIVLIFTALHEVDNTSEGRYIPPQIIDGKTIPGHMQSDFDYLESGK